MAINVEVGVALNAVLTSKEVQALNTVERQQVEALFSSVSHQSGTGGILSQKDLDVFKKSDAFKQQPAKLVGVLEALLKPNAAVAHSVGIAVSVEMDGKNFEDQLTKAANLAADAIDHRLSGLSEAAKAEAMKTWLQAGTEVVVVDQYQVAQTLTVGDDAFQLLAGTGSGFSSQSISAGKTDEKQGHDQFGLHKYFRDVTASIARDFKPPTPAHMYSLSISLPAPVLDAKK